MSSMVNLFFFRLSVILFMSASEVADCTFSRSPSMSPIPMMRCAMRLASKTSRSSVFSPQPASFIGTPVLARTARAGPPLASPSSLVSTTPVRPRRLWNVSATFTASWPVMESTTSSISVGGTAAFIVSSSVISSSSIWRRPAVSRMIMSQRWSSAYLRDLDATLTGSVSPGSGPQKWIFDFSASTLSWSTAAGRRRSHATTRGLWLFATLLAIFTAVVVFPDP